MLLLIWHSALTLCLCKVTASNRPLAAGQRPTSGWPLASSALPLTYRRRLCQTVTVMLMRTLMQVSSLPNQQSGCNLACTAACAVNALQLYRIALACPINLSCLQARNKQDKNPGGYGLKGPAVGNTHQLGALLGMSFWDAAWTLWYLSLVVCADFLHFTPPFSASAKHQREAAQEIQCKCLGNMAQVL